VCLPLSWSVHCNFTGEGKCNERGWACTPHPHQPGQILPSSLDVRQKAAVATVLCVLCDGAQSTSTEYLFFTRDETGLMCLQLERTLQLYWGGRPPSTLPAWANFTLMMECTPESSRCYSVYSVVTRHMRYTVWEKEKEEEWEMELTGGCSTLHMRYTE
jgi:hypothetical protein